MNAPLRILVVDNEPSVTLSLRFVFAGPRYEVTCEESGAAVRVRDANEFQQMEIVARHGLPS